MHPSVRCLSATISHSRNGPLTLGFIGLGAMGRHMAWNLYLKTLLAQQGPPPSQEPEPIMLLCDANEDGAKKFMNDCMEAKATENVLGGRMEFMESPRALAERANVIFTALPSSPEVKSVYLGEKGILAGLNREKDQLCVDATTLDVSVARDVSNTVREAGAEMVDAPMSGGIVGAKAGTLSFMVGGTEAAFNLAEPYLSKMGSRVIHCGASGMGLAAKISNNLVLGINQIAIAEGLLLGTSLGLEPALLTDIINRSTGRSWPSTVNNPIPGALKPPASPPCERGYEGGFASKLMLKDMSLAIHAAEDTGVPLPLGSKATDEYSNVVQDNELARKDFSVVYEYLRQRMTASRAGTSEKADLE
ncbi:3-hydroxyisobutyrate dehydrogenase [Dacryopinax primogenitus]|uniref:3-hydroxyisobutyrate dehydrogenase n=1 Tax=Dacryopinax primogenitus (strain DJM 731) TaxID=1858805 RepID=M5G3S1_DACPD|nr:3-hydroxyisobutyrate dehydrogenase [Dacryopinax primogenitus]EJT98407.1 3-hydroxyisobutyrate dehydrogenase [Dacryopinax primogenitus]